MQEVLGIVLRSAANLREVVSREVSGEVLLELGTALGRNVSRASGCSSSS